MKINLLPTITSKYPLTLPEFKQWLESKDSDDVVGRKETCDRCPIAKALLEIKEKEASVFNYKTYFWDKTSNNPEWVVSFIHQLDNSGDDPQVTASKALEIIETFCFCTVCNSSNKEGSNCGRDDCPW